MKTIKVIPKVDSKNIIILISRSVFKALKWVTFGKLDMRYDARTTTVGRTIYTGENWARKTYAEKSVEGMHEREHVRQWEDWNILYPISYLMSVWTIIFPVIAVVILWPWYSVVLSAIIGCLVPSFLSPRAFWEYRAFQFTILSAIERGFFRSVTPEYVADKYSKIIAGPQYYFAGLLVRKVIYNGFLKLAKKHWRE